MSDIFIENSWLLDKDLKNSRVIEQDDVKFFQEKAILAYLDHRVESFKILNNLVAVEDSDGNRIGSAMIYEENRRLIAVASIEYATPERLAAETRDGVRHWLRPVGKLLVRQDRFIDLDNVVFSCIEIERLVLTEKRPFNARLLPLGEPVL